MELNFHNSVNRRIEELWEGAKIASKEPEEKPKYKKKVFISLPMNGMDPDDIRENLQLARLEYLRRYNLSILDVDFVDGFDNSEPPESLDGLLQRKRVWYLGESLQKMAACDEVFFFGNWEKAAGCRLEWMVCREYGIPYMEV